MQADEDVRKIALAMPILVSKALELFLQDLCDRTYEITLQRGAKTMNALHLVPDYGHGHSDVAAEDRSISKRRKAVGDEYNDSDEESKRSKMLEMGHATSGGRGRGRGRGKGCGLGDRHAERESSHREIDSDPCVAVQHEIKDNSNSGMQVDNGFELKEPINENGVVSDAANPATRNSDMNADLNDNMDAKATAALANDPPAPANAPLAGPSEEPKHEEILGWSLSKMDRMAIDPIQLANLSRRLDEDDEEES